ncbi:uncharacterized protein LOC132064614 [Lycium ferocissimum]|uniref:uncharacterized protein LOC132064614 n=1 Tax=Lycium ferocissimum TaxID=112874 RepID=UPI002815D217|nr:uncharacterized protein LOC132064614 [Lycium ferocissimum]XP_059313636.1 uncharacterized protein LOC132064614 [Lycium ferocissimum]XP_059313637.1 uncharacterized protein LOC132064614 [Lycium ferocissimum]
MGPELENKQNTNMIFEGSAKKQKGSDSKELEASYVNCASNFQDYTSLVEQVKEVHVTEDNEIDITGCTDPADNVPVQSDKEELTESSSSFESIISEAENCTTMDGTECTSEYNGDATSELAFTGFGDIFRMMRKKVTPHWRDFIQPLRQRCKLIELKLHMLQSQTRKYEKQLRDNNHQMKLQMGSVRLEDLGSKSIPFSCNSLRDKIVKRKKRRRTEDTLDIAAYMSHHPLFSFFEKRSSADGSFLDNELDKIAICSDKINDEFGIQDDLHQQPADGDTSLEKILHNIEVLQSQVIQLKTRLDKVTSENVGLFSSTDDLKSLLPSNALTSSARGSEFLQENRVKMPVGSHDVVSQLISEYNMVMPDSAASRHGKAVNVSDVIESTDRSLLLDTNTNPEDGVLIYNQRMKEEMSNFEELKIHPVEKPPVLEHVQKVTIPASVPEPDPDLPLDDQPAPKIRSISKITAPKSKKRKARRRAGKRNY